MSLRKMPSKRSKSKERERKRMHKAKHPYNRQEKLTKAGRIPKRKVEIRNKRRKKYQNCKSLWIYLRKKGNVEKCYCRTKETHIQT